MNITELARRLKITPNELKEALPKLGFHIGPRAIQIPDKQALAVMEMWQREKEKEKTLAKIKEKISQDSGEDKKQDFPTVTVEIPDKIQVYHLAEKINLPLLKVMNELMKNGILASVNENLDYEIASIIAENLGVKVSRGGEKKQTSESSVKDRVKNVLNQEEKKDLVQRPPIVVVMGHVDHGKSSILDAIRKTKMVDQEKGGITQHIGAYQVEKNSRFITFIDTPGHEAFKAMRTRGGGMADIAILVIAADDKLQPQTMESIKIIQQEKIPFIVAINKIDRPEADAERIKKELSQINLMVEDWGGKIPCVSVSAKTKQGIEELLETIILVAEMEKDKLITNPQGMLAGVVIESHIDRGFGPVASIIVYNGTMKKGDKVVIGQSCGCLKSIKDQYGNPVFQTTAGQPVQIYGLKGLPQTGDLIEVINDDHEFKKKIKQREISSFKENAAGCFCAEEDSSSENQKTKSINFIIRADVLGSLEAIVQSLEQLEHPEIKINILKKELGNLTETDVDLAKAPQAWLVGFNVNVSNSARQLADEFGLRVDIYRVIYDLIENVKQEMNKLLSVEIIEEKIGEIEVLKVFQQKGKETILGGRLKEGKAIKDAIIRVWTKTTEQDMQRTELKGEGKIVQLQINKKDVNEIKTGPEFGLKFLGKPKIEEGDKMEVYQEIRKQKKI
ncbi:MAG: translation initiation factor IF-2 [Patescibacteria group bacterium]|jgi:translation initiation factor IF-2|nr:translation initiation factor IF-2 [Patescibacteria group bacterium]MDD5172793.1 translation initiation factor IF-2 [Patescibacteria group bacterium]